MAQDNPERNDPSSTAIALHTWHILRSIALRLMLLGSTTIGVRVLRRVGTLLGLLTMVRLGFLPW